MTLALVPAPAPGFVRGDHVELAEALLDQLGGVEDVVFDELHPWHYEPRAGVWERIEASEESRIVQSFAGERYGAADSTRVLKIKASDVTGAIRLAHDQAARPGFFSASSGIAFTDCFVSATSSGLAVKPHAQENRARAAYPFPLERGALPRRFLEFLGALFRDDHDRAEKEFFLQEFMGACILGIGARYQRSAMAIGGGDNGKSANAEVLVGMMPPGTTSAIPPQDWGQEYRRAMLVGKHLNAVGELPEREILASETFKAIVSGDPIVGRIIRESPLMFRPIAGHYFAANKLPAVSDQSDGFWRRFVVVEFNRSFKGDPSRDPHVVERVLEERAAIVAWALAGAERLIRAKDYTIPASHHAALAAWRKTANPVALFLEAETRALRADEPIAWGVGALELYTAYRRWSEANGHRGILASNTFAERLAGLGVERKHTRAGNRYAVALLSAADRAAREGV